MNLGKHWQSETELRGGKGVHSKLGPGCLVGRDTEGVPWRRGSWDTQEWPRAKPEGMVKTWEEGGVLGWNSPNPSRANGVASPSPSLRGLSRNGTNSAAQGGFMGGVGLESEGGQDSGPPDLMGIAGSQQCQGRRKDTLCLTRQPSSGSHSGSS
jgi:hypothetical protein